MSTTVPDITDDANLSQIQGNIIGGFNKDFQAFLFLHFTDTDQARVWLATTVYEVATAAEVLGFNALYKAIRMRRYAHHTRDANLPVTATWMNLALSGRGLQALDFAESDLNQFPEEFRLGMKARADQLGDRGASDPGNWVGPFGSTDDAQAVHAVMIVAADNADDREHEVARQLALMAPHGVHLLYRQDGTTRQDEPGHEHFGFKDGVSQPGVRGITPSVDPKNNPNQGDLGQDLLFPGEFVLGYRRQAGAPPVFGPGQDPGPPITTPGPVDINGPDWAFNGSYFVFRRLKQDVPGFNAFLAAQAAAEGMNADVFGAKLVGRYKSGCPLERTHGQAISVDPLAGDPSLIDRSLVAENINNFEYGDDPDGALVPHAAHIRKAYPRDQEPPGEGNTQTHRILRRGIAFGLSFVDGSAPGSPSGADTERGLCFACYQRSIADQFEFIQQTWVNNPDFPRGFQPGEEQSGHDPIIEEADDPFFNLVGKDPHVALQKWVTMTGGEYFFQPSIDALSRIASGIRLYTVQAGDTLSGIAQQFYGDASQWPHIFNANQDQISNPDLIFPGEVLKIPA